jgi:hypothetical protein
VQSATDVASGMIKAEKQQQYFTIQKCKNIDNSSYISERKKIDP